MAIAAVASGGGSTTPLGVTASTAVIGDRTLTPFVPYALACAATYFALLAAALDTGVGVGVTGAVAVLSAVAVVVVVGAGEGRCIEGADIRVAEDGPGGADAGGGGPGGFGGPGGGGGGDGADGGGKAAAAAAIKGADGVVAGGGTIGSIAGKADRKSSVVRMM